MNTDCTICRKKGEASANRCMLCAIANMPQPTKRVTSHDDMRETALLATNHGLVLCPAVVGGKQLTGKYDLLLKNKRVFRGTLVDCRTEIKKYCI